MWPGLQSLHKQPSIQAYDSAEYARSLMKVARAYLEGQTTNLVTPETREQALAFSEPKLLNQTSMRLPRDSIRQAMVMHYGGSNQEVGWLCSPGQMQLTQLLPCCSMRTLEDGTPKPDSEPRDTAELRTPQGALADAHAKTRLPGSACALVAALDAQEPVLHLANLVRVRQVPWLMPTGAPACHTCITLLALHGWGPAPIAALVAAS